MSNKRQKRHLSDEWRTMVIDAVEHGMTVTWEQDRARGGLLGGYASSTRGMPCDYACRARQIPQ